MPKLILRCNYLKNAPPAHLENFVTYIGTRDGVEKSINTTMHLPSTASQKERIQEIVTTIPDTKQMHEYYDYLQRPTRGKTLPSLSHRHWKIILTSLPKRKITWTILQTDRALKKQVLTVYFPMRENPLYCPVSQRKWQTIKELYGQMSSAAAGGRAAAWLQQRRTVAGITPQQGGTALRELQD